MNAHTNFHSHAPLVVNRRAPIGLISLIFASLAVLSLSGCIGLTGAGKPGSSSNTNSTTAGTLTASATSLNFGNVAAGSSSPQTLTLTNTGTATVKISQATVTGAGFSVVGAISSVAIPAGSNHAFQVQFAPTVSGSVSGSLSIVSDATNSTLGISLNGTGMAGLAITTQPASQTVTSGHTATFSVAAVGSGTLTYQWKKEGTGISGATSATYTTPAPMSRRPLLRNPQALRSRPDKLPCSAWRRRARRRLPINGRRTARPSAAQLRLRTRRPPRSLRTTLRSSR
jgi:hypothetical protein